ncbi:thioredoxin family protein [Glaciimonas immobilis]|uniref:Thiol-disulfide isomerase/thioredoxin n=1 Tax=Glaciimonas immobilis TaxID=728004 RepID=A0A840RKS8_9BURK|nr:thioredoxin family protein [Glaciimonas immobilis]KAF3998970.1 thioredoxin family protein [Glaciimonas immobilis]MBB5198383.1 thiol-disulfide isomerase/thioredoxin [Glaciimonas immobilis]
MPVLIIDNENRPQLAQILAEDGWVVACLCAAWCGSCREYQTSFTALAHRHPDTRFVWIDIEDQADLMDDLDVDNFPTLLIQRGQIVTFLGPVELDLRLAERIFLAQHTKNPAELAADAFSTAERRKWQSNGNLVLRLQNSASKMSAE